MAFRKLRFGEDPMLRKKSREVKEIDSKIIQLLDDMNETMVRANGIGLASPQIGILKRVIVVDIGEGLIELINPEIIEESGIQNGQEGCLSIPSKVGYVDRPEFVKVIGLNRHGESVTYEANGLLATVFCHEIDHLDGILFIDRSTELYEVEEEDNDQIEYEYGSAEESNFLDIKRNEIY